jgi:hypothetical protein
MSKCVHDFEIGSRYCVHCGQGAAELLYHANARIALLEAQELGFMKTSLEYKRRIALLEAALEKLARLGNEPNYGNSTGNVIARRALLQEQGE